MHNDASILSGVSGYAHKQAMISLCLVTQCAYYWLPQVKSKDIRSSWAAKYVDFDDPSCSCSHIGQHDTGTEGDLDLDSDEEGDHSEIGDEEDFLDVDNDE
ncbi:hypothetical protein K443DRAFT_100661 [Laccaria amethystina LaAM-08-1]|uniref:Uncharacterized protein n=1 Tax=Laccaria amethystina LaAM-08-1 TaxID=1095629 RepID=A0A0C9X5H2_9AGAR|nr:hypothetical protein K443DRAFT_100661 [Laccaria amethystina LaAM-08-1]